MSMKCLHLGAHVALFSHATTIFESSVLPRGSGVLVLAFHPVFSSNQVTIHINFNELLTNSSQRNGTKEIQ